MAIARRKRSGMFGLVAALVGMLLVSGAPMVTAAEPSTGGVLPPDAQPLGYSLRDMARKTAAMTSSGNDPETFPHTRLEILHMKKDTSVVTLEGPCDPTMVDFCGLLFTGTNTFTVPQGTQFYVPVQSVSDSAPILGTFPKRSDAVPYFFDQSQVGAENYRVIVDGQQTTLTPDYLAGPIGVTHLYDFDPADPDAEGSKIITLGAFVDSLAAGRTHTVRIVGQLSGDLLKATYDWDYYGLDFTYRVTVTG